MENYEDITQELKAAIEVGCTIVTDRDDVYVVGESPNGKTCRVKLNDWRADDWSDAVPVDEAE